MTKLFYFFLDSEMRRKVVQGQLDCPGSNYMLYGADLLPRHGFEVHHNLEQAVSVAPWPARFAWVADRFIRALGGSSGDFQTVLREWRRARKADIILSTVDNVGVPLAFLNYFGLLRRPLVYVSIGLPERIDSLQKNSLKAFYKTLYRRVPQFITYGWEEASRLREWLQLPPGSDRVTFLPFGVDPHAFTPTPDTPAETDVLSIGADMMRDFTLLLTAATELPAVSFRIITSPRHSASFGAVPANVQILTNVPFQEIRHYLARSNTVVLPCRENTYSSGTTTLLQAMAMAKPVVVTRTGAIRDGYQLENNQNCRLVSPGALDELKQAIVDLQGSPSLRDRIGSAARRTVETHFSWDQYARRLASIIQSTKNAGSPRPAGHHGSQPP